MGSTLWLRWSHEVKGGNEEAFVQKENLEKRHFVTLIIWMRITILSAFESRSKIEKI
jgi:hypothetical protein